MHRKAIVARSAVNKRVQAQVRRELRLKVVQREYSASVPETVRILTTPPESMDIDIEEERSSNISAYTSTSESDAHRFTSNSDTERDTDNIESDLRTWTIENNVTQTQLSHLLKILRKYEQFINLPCDSRTLMKTPRIKESSVCSPGEYVHFGFSRDFYSSSDINIISDPKTKWQINIDGIPITKSSGTQLWPILAFAANTNTSPIPIGIYCGNKKPENCSIFLKMFVDEVVGSQRKIMLFTCDAPARSFVTGIKGHNSFSGCGKCAQLGKSIERRVVFSTQRGPLRTDFSFRNQIDEDHHNGDTVLTQIKDLNMVDDFVFEYMHLVCL